MDVYFIYIIASIRGVLIMVDDCSVWAYHEIVDSGYLGERQAQFLSIFVRECRPLIFLEATRLVEKVFGRVGKTSTGSGSRVSELTQAGYLEKVDMVKCDVTGMTVNRWRWTGRKIPYDTKFVEVVCPYCNGVGKISKEVRIFDEVDNV